MICFVVSVLQGDDGKVRKRNMPAKNRSKVKGVLLHFMFMMSPSYEDCMKKTKVCLNQPKFLDQMAFKIRMLMGASQTSKHMLGTCHIWLSLPLMLLLI